MRLKRTLSGKAAADAGVVRGGLAGKCVKRGKNGEEGSTWSGFLPGELTARQAMAGGGRARCAEGAPQARFPRSGTEAKPSPERTDGPAGPGAPRSEPRRYGPWW